MNHTHGKESGITSADRGAAARLATWNKGRQPRAHSKGRPHFTHCAKNTLPGAGEAPRKIAAREGKCTEGAAERQGELSIKRKKGARVAVQQRSCPCHLFTGCAAGGGVAGSRAARRRLEVAACSLHGPVLACLQGAKGPVLAALVSCRRSTALAQLELQCGCSAACCRGACNAQGRAWGRASALPSSLRLPPTLLMASVGPAARTFTTCAPPRSTAAPPSPRCSPPGLPAAAGGGGALSAPPRCTCRRVGAGGRSARLRARRPGGQRLQAGGPRLHTHRRLEDRPRRVVLDHLAVHPAAAAGARVCPRAGQAGRPCFLDVP